MKPIWTIIWKSTTFFILWALLDAPFVVVFTPKIEELSQASSLYLRFYLDATGAITILLAAWIMARFVDRRSFSTLGFAPAHFVRDTFLGFVIGILWLALSLAILWVFG